MKTHVLVLILTSLSLNVFAQFPAPTNLSVVVDYVELGGESVYCGGSTLSGPAYCTSMWWLVPDTSSTAAILVGYNVYKNDDFLCFFDKNVSGEHYRQALTGTFYITAIYANPAGESAPSNVVVVSDDLPIGLIEKTTDTEFTVLFDELTQKVKIEHCIYDIAAISLYNLSGQQVATSTHKDYLVLPNLSSGIYIVKITDVQNRIHRSKIQIN